MLQVPIKQTFKNYKRCDKQTGKKVRYLLALRPVVVPKQKQDGGNIHMVG